ncbi:hypothetical protein O1611_g3234 [Lasiodiplodia mahajangana]|uniref:Uncharacterized protein n=1 Tax=Lasiodiplodia mahajangana TaxID=1108764 RepID=A0ACC2JSL5_9PEZI|nr:hypothetical protein O1611_g3234 [Lasiodiplodia mahajangana]
MPAATKWVTTVLLPRSATTLGRFVGDVSDPDDNFHDTSPSQSPPDCTNPTRLDTDYQGFDYDDTEQHGWSFKTALAIVFSRMLGIEEDDIYETRTLPCLTEKFLNPHQHFRRACQDSAVRKYLENRWRGNGPAYMVTGIMLLRYPRLVLTREIAEKASREIAALKTLFRCVDIKPLPSGLYSSDTIMVRTFGECIFAIQYHRVDCSDIHKPPPMNAVPSTHPRWKVCVGTRREALNAPSDGEARLEESEIFETTMLEAIMVEDFVPEDLSEYAKYEIFVLDGDERIWILPQEENSARRLYPYEKRVQ